MLHDSPALKGGLRGDGVNQERTLALIVKYLERYRLNLCLFTVANPCRGDPKKAAHLQSHVTLMRKTGRMRHVVQRQPGVNQEIPGAFHASAYYILMDRDSHFMAKCPLAMRDA